MSAPRDVVAPVLDAGTLREVAQWARKEEVESIRSDHGYIWAEVARQCEQDAAEAEARAPDLADWVTAATRSRLGVPDEWRTVMGDDRVRGPLLHWQPSGWRERIFVALRDGGCLLSVGVTDSLVHTPVALRAALDALAEVQP